MFSYSKALELLKSGHKVCRKGWNGKGMWLFMSMHGNPNVKHGGLVYTPEGCISLEPFIVMKTADSKYVPWLCSQSDALADDWQEYFEAVHFEPAQMHTVKASEIGLAALPNPPIMPSKPVPKSTNGLRLRLVEIIYGAGLWEPTEACLGRLAALEQFVLSSAQDKN